MPKRHLIIGSKGQIGTAVAQVLADGIEIVSGIDKDEIAEGTFDVIHVCFPYFDKFVTEVKFYQGRYLKDTGLTIIHSTVPVGMTDQIPGAVHSPVRGVHPHLYEGIKTFVKYFGGLRAEEAAQIFRLCGVKCAITTNARNTEAMKLWCTTAYGVSIALEKEIHKYCQDNGLDFDLVYTQATKSYNEGYTKLGMAHVVRPVLRHIEAPIGGHCVGPNLALLGVRPATEFVQRFV